MTYINYWLGHLMCQKWQFQYISYWIIKWKKRCFYFLSDTLKTAHTRRQWHADMCSQLACTHTHKRTNIHTSTKWFRLWPHSSPPALSLGWYVGVFSIKHLLNSNRPLFSFQRSQRPHDKFSRHTVQASPLTQCLSNPLPLCLRYVK